MADSLNISQLASRARMRGGSVANALQCAAFLLVSTRFTVNSSCPVITRRRWQSSLKTWWQWRERSTSSKRRFHSKLPSKSQVVPEPFVSVGAWGVCYLDHNKYVIRYSWSIKFRIRTCSVTDPGYLVRIWFFPLRIPDLDFSIPDSGSGFFTRDPESQHWIDK